MIKRTGTAALFLALETADSTVYQAEQVNKIIKATIDRLEVEPSSEKITEGLEHLWTLAILLGEKLDAIYVAVNDALCFDPTGEAAPAAPAWAHERVMVEDLRETMAGVVSAVEMAHQPVNDHGAAQDSPSAEKVAGGPRPFPAAAPPAPSPDLSKTPDYFTVVYRDVMPGAEAKVLTLHPKCCAMAWGNVVRKWMDRDEVQP